MNVKAVFITSALLLSGCAGSDLADLNKKISDFGFAVSGKDSSGTPVNSSDTHVMTRNVEEKKADTNKDIVVPVDVDTAAARLRRYYQFITAEEIQQVRNKGGDSRWTASAIDETHPEWSATPGSYYKMGQDWKGDDHLRIEVEKNGKGSLLYITYSSPDKSHLTEGYLKELFIQIKNVAEGTIR
ncbi:TPA: hypothetical protein KIA93_000300 [Salmonella enterica]|uniref:hypothetical protein n=1 Tax=Salmonella enterica TaxID=28901 RepID=UPI0009AFCA99|nr:hypothetical protein [Salmonella enterica]HBD1844094.1 hypothetical protein [Salmonella enterica]